MRTGGDAAPTRRWAGANWPTAADLSAARTYQITIDPLLCSEGDTIFGGWSMALIAEAARGWTAGRVRSLTANFISPVLLGDRLELRPTVLRAGRRVRQLRVDAYVEGRLTVSSAVVMGNSGDARSGTTWRPNGPANSVPPPEKCPQRSYRFRKPGSLIDVIDARLASPEPELGAANGSRVLLWARLDAEVSDDARLITLSDHLPYLVVRTLGGVRQAITVSASVRLPSHPATEWTLLDIRLLDADGEFCNGQVRMWSQTGALVGAAEQTTYLVMAK